MIDQSLIKRDHELVPSKVPLLIELLSIERSLSFPPIESSSSVFPTQIGDGRLEIGDWNAPRQIVICT